MFWLGFCQYKGMSPCVTIFTTFHISCSFTKVDLNIRVVKYDMHRVKYDMHCVKYDMHCVKYDMHCVIGGSSQFYTLDKLCCQVFTCPSVQYQLQYQIIMVFDGIIMVFCLSEIPADFSASADRRTSSGACKKTLAIVVGFYVIRLYLKHFHCFVYLFLDMINTNVAEKHKGLVHTEVSTVSLYPYI